MEMINIFNHFVTNFQNGSYKRQSKLDLTQYRFIS